MYPAGMSAWSLKCVEQSRSVWAGAAVREAPLGGGDLGCTPGGGEAAGHARRKDTLSRGDGEGTTFA